MSKQKNYLISLFLKCSRYFSSAKKNLEINENFLKSAYQSVNTDDFNKIIDENGIDRFMEEMTELTDSHFTEEEIKSLIEFYRSPVGIKLSDSGHMLKIQKIINDITTDRQHQISKMERA